MYEKIKRRLNEIQAESEQIRERLKHLPEGKLQIHKNGQSVKLFRKTADGSPNGKRVYLKQSDRAISEALALKKYLETKLLDLGHEEKACIAYLRHFGGSSNAQKYWERSEALPTLLPENAAPLPVQLERWAAASFSSTADHPEALVVKAPCGMVRSKSEAIISWELHEHHIPYRYECDLTTPYGILHPDFTIRHPSTGDFLFWEHFGRMDDPQYVKNNLPKIQTYLSLGFVPTVNLIVTFETAAKPLDIEFVKMLIRHYFL